MFVLPIVLVLGGFFFLWNWSPSWLDLRINRLLMLVDPAGVRWLNETYLKVDRGADFYNTQRIGFDGAVPAEPPGAGADRVRRRGGAAALASRRRSGSRAR